MKIIFLDIDGVLNSTDWYSSGRSPGNINGQEGDLDPECIKILNKIIDATDARIVISSDWRINFQPTCLRLYKAGLIGNIIGYTKYDWNSIYNPETSRGNEIQEWININAGDLESFLILDDRRDFLPEHLPSFIHIDPMYGLTEKYLDKAIEILSK